MERLLVVIPALVAGVVSLLLARDFGEGRMHKVCLRELDLADRVHARDPVLADEWRASAHKRMRSTLDARSDTADLWAVGSVTVMMAAGWVVANIWIVHMDESASAWLQLAALLMWFGSLAFTVFGWWAVRKVWDRRRRALQADDAPDEVAAPVT